MATPVGAKNNLYERRAIRSSKPNCVQQQQQLKKIQLPQIVQTSFGSSSYGSASCPSSPSGEDGALRHPIPEIKRNQRSLKIPTAQRSPKHIRRQTDRLKDMDDADIPFKSPLLQHVSRQERERKKSLLGGGDTTTLQLQSSRTPTRTQSARYKRRPTTLGKTLQQQPPPRFRTRTGSIPTHNQRYGYDDEDWMPSSTNIAEARFLQLPESDDYTRLRAFSIEKGCLINRGDSFRRRSGSSQGQGSSHSNSAMNSRDQSPMPRSSPQRDNIDRGSTGSSPQESPPAQQITVTLVGREGTGKTALIKQFLTSEFSNPFNTDLDESYADGNNTVVVLLEGTESEMCFVEIDCGTSDAWQYVHSDAYIVLYSVDARESFLAATGVVNTLLQNEKSCDKPIILVANKIDLARKMVVPPEEGMSLAKSCNCNFLEISVALHVNIDELLVGILTKIRHYKNERLLMRTGDVTVQRRMSLMHRIVAPANRYHSSSCSNFSRAGRFMKKCFGRNSSAQSCEDLAVFRQYND